MIFPMQARGAKSLENNPIANALKSEYSIYRGQAVILREILG